MVQMKATREPIALTLVFQFFISHMVQMKALWRSKFIKFRNLYIPHGSDESNLRKILTKKSIKTFISHMVQMKVRYLMC